MPIFSQNVHRSIFLWSTALALICLPFSEYVLSIAIIAISVNWIFEGEFIRKVKEIRQRKSLLFFLLIYLSLLIGCFYTSNVGYGLSELRLKLPLLLLPVIFSTTKKVNSKELFLLFSLFILAVLVASFYSTFLFLNNFRFGSANVREISPFISHIRFGLMINLAIFTSLFYFFNFPLKGYKRLKWIFVSCMAWFILFLLILQSLTGIVVFFSTSIFLLIIYTFKTTSQIGRYVFVVLISFILLFSLSYISHTIDNFFTRKFVDIQNLPQYTINGNLYTHDITKIQYENGYPVWLNICWTELENEWNKKSEIPFSSNDRLGQPIKYTIIRYITSKGLTKDSLGLESLDDIDIELIEAGVTSEIFRHNRFGIYPRLYQFLWEIDQYLILGQVNGSPFIQRLIYAKAALSIIKSNLWFGVGTGDLVDEFNSFYNNTKVDINVSFRFLSHNQFLTHWVAVGIFGLLAFILGWFLPFIIEKRQSDFLSLIFLFIITLSMLNEDTLQTHIGVCLTSLFYSILIFGKDSTQQLLCKNGLQKD